mmetsp:Transcript_38400/g.53456  ORF Transcript_38400/g.53456 Transcript_38400/m.53456 type:complete len:411 (+) Transcript_38400:418-1650(+)|eukprot:CAMPEP_0201489900 /NCGR_PEP_ID=MMETSP0151_2-20130828/24098_1 /ASSEMBLY_ACC=CAM_ASM_000257 /TAXON_ID=200890 /ORGANISM="Paramoeba atlantica, Strain 621/1 / CCAP 1560/9" /LENGTH=410 /DNA_ID=CAMNT_0047875635 /DNA_START=66 /DNA_END=1298 /DNA_ORIENTATION=+
MRFALLFLCSLFVVLSIQKSEKTTSAFFSWNGFDFQWEREIPLVGVREGHKLGNFAGFLEDQSYEIDDEGELNAKSTASMTFTPGVDGDIANPALYYSLTYSEGFFVSDPTTHHFAFSDNATQKKGDNSSKVVTADSAYVIPVLLTVPPLYEQYEVLLTGMDMQMTCDPAKQPANYPCNANSDSIWPTDLELDVEKCTQIGATQLSCTISFQVGRATPSGSIPSDFNWAVDYSVDIYLTAIAANKSTAYFERAAKHVTQNSGTHDDLVRGAQPININSDTLYDQGFVTMAGFGFKITSLFTHDGRNLDGYTFYIGDTDYNVSQSGSTYESSLVYSYAMGVQAPVSSFPANTKLYHRSLTILLAPNATYTPSTAAVGTVCQSEGVFLCQLHGVAFDHTTTTTKIDVKEQVQ